MAAIARATNEQKARLADMVRASPRLMRFLRACLPLGLPDWMLASGAVYQTAWNAITGRDPDYGIKDFDLFYHYAKDVSYEHEDFVIKTRTAQFPADIAPLVEIRNQARVHLWFEQKFGEPYAPLQRSAEALERFVAPAFAVGVQLQYDDWVQIDAPLGLDDLFAMRIRANPTRPKVQRFREIAENLKARWPELTIEE
ncbi:MAG: nucleotidyltransferase family protein [Hyphomonadaceae bacterium]